MSFNVSNTITIDSNVKSFHDSTTTVDVNNYFRTYGNRGYVNQMQSIILTLRKACIKYSIV